jgi:hypothetical protein
MNKNRHQELVKLTRHELINEIVKAYEVEASSVARIVELYYDCQDHRKRHAAKKRTEEPRDLDAWFQDWLLFGETLIQNKLEEWVTGAEAPPESKWAFDQYGIGPVLAAGLAAHIDVTRANSPSAVWKFAGLAPGFDKRVKGVKLPFNGALKSLCWKISDSFVKFSGKEACFYGKLYREFKAEELRRNGGGHYKAAAAAQLKEKRWRDDTQTKQRLEKGQLSDAHLDMKARRRTVKIFLVHYWEEGRKARGLPVRPPYAGGVLGHDGIIPPPAAPPKEEAA